MNEHFWIYVLILFNLIIWPIQSWWNYNQNSINRLHNKWTKYQMSNNDLQNRFNEKWAKVLSSHRKKIRNLQDKVNKIYFRIK